MTNSVDELHQLNFSQPKETIRKTCDILSCTNTASYQFNASRQPYCNEYAFITFIMPLQLLSVLASLS